MHNTTQCLIFTSSLTTKHNIMNNQTYFTRLACHLTASPAPPVDVTHKDTTLAFAMNVDGIWFDVVVGLVNVVIVDECGGRVNFKRTNLSPLDAADNIWDLMKIKAEQIQSFCD